VCSRRNADKLVEEGRVKINNVTVTELGKTVNENNDTVTVDGIAVKPVKNYMYVLFINRRDVSRRQATRMEGRPYSII